jgi:hypothetical protein
MRHFYHGAVIRLSRQAVTGGIAVARKRFRKNVAGKRHDEEAELPGSPSKNCGIRSLPSISPGRRRPGARETDQRLFDLGTAAQGNGRGRHRRVLSHFALDQKLGADIA